VGGAGPACQQLVALAVCAAGQRGGFESKTAVQSPVTGTRHFWRFRLINSSHNRRPVSRCCSSVKYCISAVWKRHRKLSCNYYYQLWFHCCVTVSCCHNNVAIEAPLACVARSSLHSARRFDAKLTLASPSFFVFVRHSPVIYAACASCIFSPADSTASHSSSDAMLWSLQYPPLPARPYHITASRGFDTCSFLD